MRWIVRGLSKPTKPELLPAHLPQMYMASYNHVSPVKMLVLNRIITRAAAVPIFVSPCP
jgi:hypothetical protein